MERKDLPGMPNASVLYADEKIVLRGFHDMVNVYIMTEYGTPLFGKKKRDFLSAAEWKKDGDIYYQRDGIGRRTGLTAKSIEEIVAKEMERRSES